jgi:hypothetical protein
MPAQGLYKFLSIHYGVQEWVRCLLYRTVNIIIYPGDA